MNGTRQSAAMAARRSAVISACRSFSIAQGPPMRTSGPPPPIVMEPTGDEVRVLGDLDDLDQVLLGPDPGDAQAGLLEAREVVVVHLVPVAMTLLDDPLPVQP